MNRIVALLLLTPSLLVAQNPSDTGNSDGRQRREAWVRGALSLTTDQAAKLEATRARFAPQRRAVMERRRAIVQGLRGQLQPGIAANADSVRKLLDARDQNRSALAQLQRDEEKEMAGYLSPVQRARLDLLRERFAGMRSRRGRGGRSGRGGWGAAGSWHRHRSQ
jgi:Spy/CpxP family protein refolding chaperone